MTTAAKKQLTHAEQVQAVQEVVCRQYSVSMQEMLGKGKPSHVVIARQVAMSIARDLLRFGTIELACHFNRKEHGTILWACKRVVRLRFNGKAFLQEYDRLRDECMEAIRKPPLPAPKKRKAA